MASHRTFDLNEWRIVVGRGRSGLDAFCVSGYVSGNPRFAEAELVTTSLIRSYRLEPHSVVVVTRKGSQYRLGKPSAGEPFAMQRLLRHLANLPPEPVGEGDADLQTIAPRFDAVEMDEFVLAREK